ncbi:HEAT repeat domain-containing protein [Halorhabdus amylolytica]|uniref:HEAT repeat domain-containing protein n=1 Tax=Halorhabdus amylolytica TaxID=2559573 RepID=UPI0010AB2279|nr:HEAT repeat domain-containing protein [Halorhabdus amylolytica]
MTEIVSAFGYSVSLTVVLIVAALVIGLALAVMFWLTVGLSIYRSIEDTRRARVRDELQEQLLEGTFDPDFDWETWVAGLSGVERDVVESLLDEYLRELDGQNVERLRELGDALGIADRSKRRLERGGEYERLYALTWLTLLERPENLHAAEFSPRTQRERAAVARLRYESNDFENPREGISLLLEGARSQFTVFGQDTLYRIGTEDPEALLDVAERNYATWPEPLLVQVLVVCRHLAAGVTTEDLSWLTAALEADNEAVREAAALALGNVGWRKDVRSDLFLDRLVADPSPRVRGAIYRMLARWSDQQALDTLLRALENEFDPRTRLLGTEALGSQRDQLPEERATALGDAWTWSHEHAKYDRTARNPGGVRG